MSQYEESMNAINTAQLIQSLEQEAVDWKQKYEDSQTEVKNWKQKNQDSEKESMDWQQKYQTLETESRSWKQKYQTSEKEKKDIWEQLDLAISENSRLKKIGRDDSSTISELENELQKKSDKIINLQSQISTLENSEPILKEARRIQSSNKKKEGELADRERQCISNEEETVRKLEQAASYEKEQKRILDDVNAEVDSRADLKILGITDQLKNEYAHRTQATQGLLRKKYTAKYWWHNIVFSYCTLWTLIQAATSEALRNDFIMIGLWLKDYVLDRIQNIKVWTGSAAGIADKIPNETVSGICHWLLLGIVGILLIAVFFGIPLLSVWFIIRYLKNEDRFDKTNRWIMVFTGMLAITISWTDFFGLSDYCLPLIWVGIQIEAPLIRWLWSKVHKEKEWV